MNDEIDDILNDTEGKEETDNSADSNDDTNDGADNGTASGKIDKLFKQYNKILVDLFKEYSVACIEDALKNSSGPLGSNIQEILDDALCNLKDKILSDLGLEASETPVAGVSVLSIDGEAIDAIESDEDPDAEDIEDVEDDTEDAVSEKFMPPWLKFKNKGKKGKEDKKDKKGKKNKEDKKDKKPYKENYNPSEAAAENIRNIKNHLMRKGVSSLNLFNKSFSNLRERYGHIPGCLENAIKISIGNGRDIYSLDGIDAIIRDNLLREVKEDDQKPLSEKTITNSHKNDLSSLSEAYQSMYAQKV